MENNNVKNPTQTQQQVPPMMGMIPPNPMQMQQQPPKQDNWFVRACKWTWANKWTILSAFVAGAGAGAGAKALWDGRNNGNGGNNGPLPPTGPMGPTV